jgi:predicted transcriptional regulator
VLTWEKQALRWRARRGRSYETDRRSKEAAVDRATPTPTVKALLDALVGRPDTTAAELAEAAGIGRSTTSKLLAALATQGRVLRRPGGYHGGRRTSDRWTLIATTTGTTQDAAAASMATPPTHTTQAADPDTSRPGPGRLGAGELRDLVENCLTQRPDQALSATTVAKTLDRSAGAVANALQALASQGRVVQAHTRPRRYVIAHASDPIATTD